MFFWGQKDTYTSFQRYTVQFMNKLYIFTKNRKNPLTFGKGSGTLLLALNESEC